MIKSDKGRLHFTSCSDTQLVGKRKNKYFGFKRHNVIVGFFLSCMGLSFNSKNAGYLNKKSVIHYLQRNLQTLNDDERNTALTLTEDSKASAVKILFEKIQVRDTQFDKNFLIYKQITKYIQDKKNLKSNANTLLHLIKQLDTSAARDIARCQAFNYFLDQGADSRGIAQIIVNEVESQNWKTNFQNALANS